MSRPTIIGECNPYGGLDEYALYPAPDGCSGHRLCCLILQMRRKDYLEVFDRANLCEGRFTMAAARDRAIQFVGRRILLGAKVLSVFGFRAPTFSIFGDNLVLPHPSGLCRKWNEPGAMDRARELMREFVPEAAHLIGIAGDTR